MARRTLWAAIRRARFRTTVCGEARSRRQGRPARQDLTEARILPIIMMSAPRRTSRTAFGGVIFCLRASRYRRCQAYPAIPPVRTSRIWTPPSAGRESQRRAGRSTGPRGPHMPMAPLQPKAVAFIDGQNRFSRSQGGLRIRDSQLRCPSTCCAYLLKPAVDPGRRAFPFRDPQPAATSAIARVLDRQDRADEARWHLVLHASRSLSVSHHA